ncbi:MAG: tyrosine-protein phosphatase [Clostridia bacterium]|nr:tyrosine-protein phosphatase [Clostridia bacterium]
MRKCISFFRRSFLPVLLVLMLLPAACLSAAVEDLPLAVTYDALEDPEFGAVFFGCTPAEFTADGFMPGDSCSVALSNGFVLDDVPVYTGYYTKTDCPAIVLYPGYAHPAFTYVNTGDMWTRSGTAAGDTVTVTLLEAGRYLTVEESLSAVYSNDRDTYASDIVFSNFRQLSGGRLRAGMFYRGASPVDDRNSRAAITDSLIREAGIGFILDLADTSEKAAAYPLFAGSRFEELYSEGSAACLGLTAAYRDPDYAAALADGLRAMMKQDRPVYIHCTEGKDRTGFVCILLEALAGATREELERDYMITYDNYYGINAADTPEKYAANVQVRFLDMAEWLAGVPEGTDISVQMLEEGARGYLRNTGMTDDEIDSLILYLTGSAS